MLAAAQGKERDAIPEVEKAMSEELTTDAAAAHIRHARFGRLPERIRFEDMTEEVAAPGAAKDSYDPEGAWKYYSCLALDLGL